MLADSREALVRRAVDAIWNRRDLDVADELFASNYVSHNGLIADLVLGPEAIKISAVLHRLAFPALRVVVDDVSTDQGLLVLHWTASSGRQGQTDGGTNTPQQQSLSGITRSRFAGGRIVESWTEWDRIRVLRELRLAPPG